MRPEYQAGNVMSAAARCSWPILSRVIDPEDLDGILLDPVDGDAGQRSENKLASTCNPTQPAAFRKQVQAHAPIVKLLGYLPRGCWVVPANSTRDAFEIASGRAGPANRHQDCRTCSTS